MPRHLERFGTLVLMSSCSAPVTSSYDEDDEAVPTMGPFHRVIVALDMQDVPAMSQGENVRRDTESQSLQVGELQETNTTSGARVVAGDSYAGDHNNTEETHVPAMPSHLFSEPGPSQDSRLLLRNVRRRPGVVYFANGNDAGGKGGSRPGAMTRRIGAITVQHHQTIQPAFSLSDPTFLPRKNRNKS
ncbi:hypothetical protein PENSPDRAFT_504969 [Peniophora sp. CONT]|nr:hypothetical protein PENSPDRAFT_504969 [Peniophora sp. CONT]